MWQVEVSEDSAALQTSPVGEDSKAMKKNDWGL